MDNINFKSRIAFVDSQTFVQTANGVTINHLSRDVARGKEFWSLKVRTCTGGGIVSPNKRQACGFHILDSYSNALKLDKVIKKIFRFASCDSPERALIIGGKDVKGGRCSLQNFREIKLGLMQKIPFVTRFEQHMYKYGESSFYYNLKNDTWLILAGHNGAEVSTPEDLKIFYKKINIAKGDELFIGNKKIQKEDYPEFFDSSTFMDYFKNFLKNFF